MSASQIWEQVRGKCMPLERDPKFGKFVRLMANVMDEMSLECPPECLEVGQQADLRSSKSQQPNLRGPDRFWLLMEALSHNGTHRGARWDDPMAGGKNGGSCGDRLTALPSIRAKHDIMRCNPKPTRTEI